MSNIIDLNEQIMKIDDKIFQELNSGNKEELVEELIEQKSRDGKSTLFKKLDLNSSGELSKLIVENSHDGIMIIGNNYIIEYVNTRLCELTSFSEQSILNKDFRIFLKATDKELAIERYNARRNGDKLSSSFELPIITKNNERKIFEIRSTVFNDYEGNVKTLSQFKDITARKTTEEAIRQSEEKFRSIVENSHLGIVIINMNYQFEYVNDQFCNILYSSKNKLIGKDFREYISKDSLKLVSEYYKKRQNNIEVPSEYEIKLVRTDGEERIVKLSSSVVNFSGNIKTIAQVLDITEKVKQENLQRVILKISQAVNEESNLTEFLKIVRNELSSILDTKNFYVAMYDEITDTYTFPFHVDEYDSIDDITQLELKDSLTDYVRRNNHSILVDADVQAQLEIKGEVKGIVGESCPIWLGAPLVVDNVVVGVIGIQNYHDEDAYNENDLELLKIISENVSSAIWRKQIIDKLTQSESRYRDFISRSSEGIYRIDFDPPVDTRLPVEEQIKLIVNKSCIGECNDMFSKMYGLDSPEKLIGKSLLEFYGGVIKENDKNYIANKQFIESNYRTTNLLTKEIDLFGNDIYISNNSVGVVKDNYLIHAWGIQKDITEKKKVEDVLTQIAEGIYSTMDESFFNSLVTFLGGSLEVDYAIIAKLENNKNKALTLACWDKDRLVDNFEYQVKDSPCEFVLEKGEANFFDSVSELFPKDQFLQKNRYQCYMGRALKDSQQNIVGVIYILYKNKIKNVELAKSVLKIFESRCSAELERLQYVKEIVEAKDEAERSNKLKSDFLAQMSHEIRTPVNTILSFTSLLKESLEDKLNDDLKDSFKIIDNGGRRLIRTIDLILNVSQIQSGSLTLSLTKINIIEILKDLISEFRQSASKEGLDLIFESDQNILDVFADNYTITQIFANLIHNSIKYTTKGSIKVMAEKSENDEVIVQVKDTGVGMSDKFLTELFDPFSQEETGYTRKFEGTGLGLTLVRKYCELNNAQISVKSKKNAGSTFIIIFNNVKP